MFNGLIGKYFKPVKCKTNFMSFNYLIDSYLSTLTRKLATPELVASTFTTY